MTPADPKTVHVMEQATAALRDMATALGQYRDHLLAAGFSREEALGLVVLYSTTALTAAFSPRRE